MAEPRILIHRTPDHIEFTLTGPDAKVTTRMSSARASAIAHELAQLAALLEQTESERDG